jgi:hypothetical protein
MTSLISSFVPTVQITAVNHKSSFITNKQIVTFFLKTILHFIFRLFSRPPKNTTTIVRAWCDVTSKMFAEQMKTSNTRIFPFPFSLKRQYKFIQWCQKEKLPFSLDGIPYSLREALSIFFANDKILALAQAEKEANSKYSEKLLDWNTLKVFTSDEFEVASQSIYREALKKNIHVTNCAHGIGTYCPYVAYSEFWTLTSEQGEFYQKFNPQLQISLRQSQNSQIPLSVENSLKNDMLSLVLIHQNFAASGLSIEHIEQLNLAHRLTNIAKKLNIPFFIKLHPNTPDSMQKSICNEMAGQQLSNWKNLEKYRPIFFSVNSTMYFEAQKIAPFIFYKKMTFMPEIYFGKNIHVADDETIENSIYQLNDKIYWKNAIEKQNGLER